MSPGSPGPATWDADDAVEHLYAAHWRRLVRLSVLLVRDQGVAEEVVQDAFVAMHGRWRRLRDPDKALAYLRQAVVNRSRSALRHRGVVERHVARQRAASTPLPGADETAAGPGPPRARCSTRCATCRPASARCSRCATTSTSPRPRSPMPSASAAARSRATPPAAPPPCAASSPTSSRRERTGPVNDDDLLRDALARRGRPTSSRPTGWPRSGGGPGSTAASPVVRRRRGLRAGRGRRGHRGRRARQRPDPVPRPCGTGRPSSPTTAPPTAPPTATATGPAPTGGAASSPCPCTTSVPDPRGPAAPRRASTGPERLRRPSCDLLMATRRRPRLPDPVAGRVAGRGCRTPRPGTDLSWRSADDVAADRPADMIGAEAELALQQVVYTAPGLHRRATRPCGSCSTATRSTSVFGVPTDRAGRCGPALWTCSTT